MAKKKEKTVDIAEYIQHRSSVVSKIVEMKPERFLELCYTKRDVSKLKADKKAEFGDYPVPAIDIIRKKSRGVEAALAAKSEKLKEIPVIIIANKASQIGWYLNRKGIK